MKVAAVAIGHESASEIVSQNVARDLPGASRDILKVNEFFIAMHPEIRSIAIGGPVRFISLDGTVAAGLFDRCRWRFETNPFRPSSVSRMVQKSYDGFKR